MSGSASGGIPSPTRNSFPPITPLSGTVVRISIVFDEGTDQSGCDGSEDEVAWVLRDRDAVAGLRVRGLTGTRSLVRELRGLICATMRSGDRRRKEVRPSLKEIADRAAAEAERQAIRLALHATRGNKSEAARLLRVDYKTLHLKMKHYGIDAGEFRAS